MTDLHNNARIGQQNINSTVYNQYLGREVRRFFNLPPHYPDVFIGREDDLPKIKELLFSDDNILLLVNGEGGIGKTTVAARYFHAYWEDYQHLAWVFVEESIIKALLNLAIALEVKFPQQASLEEQLGLLLTTLAQLDRPCLLVLDNANQRAELESYYPALRRCPNMHLLLTSRIADLPTAHSYSVQPLDETEAQQLFQKHYSLLTAEETQLLPAIFEAVGYNTLVIELMAKNLTNFNNVLEKRYTLHNLLADLREKGILHLSHSRAVLTNYHAGLQMQYAKAEDIIAAMYDLNDLTPTEQQLLTCFALLPAESIPYATLKTLITDIPELDQMLLRLTRSGWLDMDATNKDFKVSPVVQEVTLQKVENATKATEPLIEQLLTLLKYEFGTGHLLNATYEEGRLYARYGANVIDVLEEPSYALSVLTERVARYYNTVGNIALALTYFEAMLRNDQQLLTQAPENPTYKNGLAISYQYLGRTQSALGNLEDALTFYQQFNQLAQELQHDFSDNVEFKNLLAISYQCLGNTKSALGNLEDALTFYQQYNQLEQELHYDFPDHVESKNLLAISYQYLGETQIALGNLEGALAFYQQFNQLVQELHHDFPDRVDFKKCLATSYQYLGNTQSTLGNLEDALAFYQKDAQLSEELHHDFSDNVAFKKCLATSYQHLGRTQIALGNLEDALAFYQQFNQLAQELHHDFPDHVDFKEGLAISYQYLGRTQIALGNLEDALAFYQQFNQLAQELHHDFPDHVDFKEGLAISYQYLGNTQSALGNLEDALDFYQHLNQLEQELHYDFPDNVDFKNGLAISYQCLGETQSTLGNLEDALDFYQQLNQLEQELHYDFPGNVDFKEGLAISYFKLGACYQQHDQLILAKDYFQRAAALWQALATVFPSYVEFSRNLAEVKEILAEL